MKRIVTIQDISCIGKCSLTAALPVISAMGIETAILPTAVLSTHTMFPNPCITSLQDRMAPIAAHWKSLGFTFDAIYSGYLASPEEVSLVREFFRDFDTGSTLRFVDPAMADYGKLYSGFGEDFPRQMGLLCGEADIIVPNLTEAALLTGLPYRTEYDEDYVRQILQALASLGTRKAVVVTGMSPEPGQTGFCGMDVQTGEIFRFSQEKLQRSYHGTGDLFASVTVGSLVRGFSLQRALETAAGFVAAAIRETMTNDPEKTYGVDFEAVLPELIASLRL